MKIIKILAIILCILHFKISAAKELDILPEISISQIADHPGLNRVYEGVIKALADHGFDQSNLVINKYNALGQQVVNMQIAKKIASNDKNKLAITISTPSTQALIANRKNNLSLVFSSITDPEMLGSDLINITGSSDQPPLTKLWEVINNLPLKINKIGIIYNSSEANSLSLVSKIKTNRQFEIIEKTVNNTSQVKQAMLSIINDIDVLLITQDNTLVSAADVVFNTIKKNREQLPIIVLDSALINKGALISVGFSQYEVGYLAGKKAARILKGEKIENIPISTPEKIELIFNQTVIDKMGIKIEQKLLKQGAIKAY